MGNNFWRGTFCGELQLALSIVKGFRREITKDTPPFYQDLMQKCWHSDPTQRPTAKEICNLTQKWVSRPTQEIQDQIRGAEEVRQQNIGIKRETKIPHPGAIYTSRLLTNITNGKKLFIFYKPNFIILTYCSC